MILNLLERMLPASLILCNDGVPAGYAEHVEA